MTARQWRNAAAVACGSLLVVAAVTMSGSSEAATGESPPCTVVSAPPAQVTATTLDTVEQAYYCIFAHFYGGESLDDRTLLASAFAGFTEELLRHGTDHPDATMPALSGNRADDWAAFAAVYERVTGDLPATWHQSLAEATLTAMVNSLRDNHATWNHDVQPPAGYAYGLGLVTSPISKQLPEKVLPPVYASQVYGGPAAAAGLLPGDIVESVNGAPLFADGVLSTGALTMLYPKYTVDDDPVRLTLRRPATGRTWKVTLTPALFKLGGPPSTTAKATPTGDVAVVKVPIFMPGAADRALADIAKQAESTTLTGVVLDLRGNTGGSPEEVDRLLGAFAHGRITGYECDAAGDCDAQRTDDTVPLLNLPLVELTDGDCGSACDHFTSAVKDLGLGPVVGARTSGIVSGAAVNYLLSNNSTLFLPARHHLGPDHETIDGIGVAPDHHAPRTARDLSTGRDPGLDKALALLAK